MSTCRRIRGPVGLPLWALLWVTCALLGCGYRPVASLSEGVETAIYVPVFESYATYPELDVHAGSYLSTRLAARGLRVTSRQQATDTSASGVLLRTHEETLMLHDDSAVSEIVVTVRVDVTGIEGQLCETPTVEGRAVMVVSYEVLAESDRQAALQEATEQAIERLLNDVILCVHQVYEGGLAP